MAKNQFQNRQTRLMNSSLADGVDLVEDDDVEARVGAHPLLLLLGLGEETPDVGLGLAYVPCCKMLL